MNILQDNVNGILFTTIFGSGAGLFPVSGKYAGAAQLTKQALLHKAGITQMAITAGSDISILGWINPESGTQAHIEAFYDSNNELAVHLNHNTGIANVFGPGGSEFDVSGIVPSLGSGWYFFCLQLVNGKMGIQINNGTLHEDSATHHFSSSFATGTFEIGNLVGGSVALDFDEVCIFMHGLDDATKAEIWNSGNGRTFP